MNASRVKLLETMILFSFNFVGSLGFLTWNVVPQFMSPKHHGYHHIETYRVHDHMHSRVMKLVGNNAILTCIYTTNLF